MFQAEKPESSLEQSLDDAKKAIKMFADAGYAYATILQPGTEQIIFHKGKLPNTGHPSHTYPKYISVTDEALAAEVMSSAAHGHDYTKITIAVNADPVENPPSRLPY